jgi:hypothetical protein
MYLRPRDRQLVLTSLEDMDINILPLKVIHTVKEWAEGHLEILLVQRRLPLGCLNNLEDNPHEVLIIRLSPWLLKCNKCTVYNLICNPCKLQVNSYFSSIVQS